LFPSPPRSLDKTNASAGGADDEASALLEKAHKAYAEADAVRDQVRKSSDSESNLDDMSAAMAPLREVMADVRQAFDARNAANMEQLTEALEGVRARAHALKKQNDAEGAPDDAATAEVALALANLEEVDALLAKLNEDGSSAIALQVRQLQALFFFSSCLLFVTLLCVNNDATTPMTCVSSCLALCWCALGVGVCLFFVFLYFFVFLSFPFLPTQTQPAPVRSRRRFHAKGRGQG